MNPALLVLLVLAAQIARCAPPAVDLSSATVISAASGGLAVEMLRDEVERRTGIRWAVAAPGSDVSGPAVVLGRGKGPAEGFSAAVSGTRVSINGNDARGMPFGAGHFLRNLEMRRGEVRLRADYRVSASPQTPLRGHQLGYRNIPNSYDGWTVSMWEQYIRDLVVFGANAIELLPPRTDDISQSPHFPLPPMRMMIAMSHLIARYGLDVWVWYPALDEDYSDPKTVEFALEEWGRVFRQLPRIDHVLVPAGDPGHTPAKYLLPLIEKQAANLRRYHPKAGMWIAPQGFDAASIEDFFSAVNRRPSWLTGIVHGPQTRISLPDLRARLAKELPIRLYPDITHTRTCQLPVPDWDTAFALTSSREPINPRPVDQAAIYRLFSPYTIGFLAYSEGCNDDVNKAIWSGLGWNRDTPVVDILRDYARYFIGPDFADDFAQGLFALERNWRGPVLLNAGIGATLRQFQAMERAATPQMIANWRFQQGLYRAYYDAHVQRRLMKETVAEEDALDRLRAASRTGSMRAMTEAESILDQARDTVTANDLRTRVFQLAEALFQSIHMQLAVERYGAIAPTRGATLDTFELPLTNAPWIKEQFERIRALPAERDRLAEIAKIVGWTDPGPGGFYDDLGNPSRQPHLVPGPGFAEDPAFFRSPLVFFDPRGRGRQSWWNQIIGLYEAPIRMRYENLDATAGYRLRVVYGGGPLRLVADGSREIHPLLDKTFEPLEFPVPRDATSDGVLNLEWRRAPGGGGPGRGNQVAEVWMTKER